MTILVMLIVILWAGGSEALTQETICNTDPNVIFCDNFNDRTLGDVNTFYNPNTNFQTNLGGKSTAWGNNNVAGNIGQTITDVGCLEGRCFSQFYPANPQNNAFGGGFVGSQTISQLGGPSQIQEFYYRFWMLYPTNWVESPNGSKVVYGEGGIGFGPRQEIGSDIPNGWPWVERGFVNNIEGRIPVNMNASFSGRRLGQWQCLEYHMKHETVSPTAPGVGGSNDGVWEAWVNDPAGGPDIQIANYHNIYFNLVGDSGGYASGTFYTDWLISAFWNCDQNNCTLSQNAHPDMTRLVDKVVVSRARIGCGSVVQPTLPGTPANLVVN